MKKISIVIPAYNEEGNIRVIAEVITDIFQPLAYEYELIFVNDGSVDHTPDILLELSQKDRHIYYIELSRNFGHQSALKAGMDCARGDCVITMDCDMQHPPCLINEMLAKWEEGYDVVYTRRLEDQRIPYFKRITSRAFYRFRNKISDIELEEGTADFRLVDRRVAQVVSSLTESDLFIRGIIKWVGFKQYAIAYEPGERFSGTTKYTAKSMFNLALKGITSFSVSPLYIAMYIGFAMSVLSSLYLPYVLYSYFTGDTISGWSSIMLTVVFFGGIQLMILGILGIYLGRLFIQSKNRPNYIIKETNLS
ncbi:MAG: glycosyltransferase family 2 protein [Tannerellaceae bacterium]|jgi:dolichol-phosphate mannosyltransferase|nr:glycosyltransferase family 2 protein [Tannerellaceae bacterium]